MLKSLLTSMGLGKSTPKPTLDLYCQYRECEYPLFKKTEEIMVFGNQRITHVSCADAYHKSERGKGCPSPGQNGAFVLPYKEVVGMAKQGKVEYSPLEQTVKK